MIIKQFAPGRRRFLAALLLPSLMMMSGWGFAKASEPSEVVRDATNTILEQIKARRSEFESSDQALDAFVRSKLGEHIDQQYSARLVLGLHGRSATKQQIDEFAQALSDNLMRRYGRALLEIDASTAIEVTGESPLRDGRIMRVNTKVLRSGGAPIPVDYMMRPGADGKWRAFDVIVEGVSYVQTHRSQFDQPIRQRGLDSVISDLREDRIELDVQ